MLRVLLTSGGTRAKIDEVRHVGNLSSGTFGNHICNALLEAGHEVIFLYAHGSKCAHEIRVDMRKPVDINQKIKEFRKYEDNYTEIEYNYFDDYAKKLRQQLALKPEVVILAAAVSDYAPIKTDGKISSELDTLTIQMEKTPKLIREVKAISPDSFLVGFKLLVGSTQEQLLKAMSSQMESVKADMVVGNDLRDIKANSHKLTILFKDKSSLLLDKFNGNTLAILLVKQVEERVKQLKTTLVPKVTPHPQQTTGRFVVYDWAHAVGSELIEKLGFKHNQETTGDIMEAAKLFHENNILVMTRIGNDCMILCIDTPRGSFRQR